MLPTRVCVSVSMWGQLKAPLRLVSVRKLGNFSMGFETALDSAEKVLGYSTRNLSLMTVLRDIFPVQGLSPQNEAHLNDNHPLVSTVKEVDRQSYGLISLLLAKALNQPSGDSSGDPVDPKHLLLAETVEIIQGGCLLHSKVSHELDNFQSREPSRSRLPPPLPPLSGHFKDKLVISSGYQLMFGRASRNLGSFRNTQVMVNLSKSIQDFVEGEFMADEVLNDIAMGLSKNNDLVGRWEGIKFLKYGSLLGNTCKSMALLSHHDYYLQEVAYDFGKNFALTLETYQELQYYLMGLSEEKIKINGPLLILLTDSPEYVYLLKSHQNCGLVSAKVHEMISKSEAMKKTRAILELYTNNVFTALELLKDSEAKLALTNIMLSLNPE